MRPWRICHRATPLIQAVRDVRVLALVQRRADQDDDPSRRERCRVNEWEIPFVEVVFETLEDGPLKDG
jgi:hypothetical protein